MNEPATFTDEDRATLDRFARGDVGSSRVGKATARALAHIDQLEGALEAADELARIIETSLPVPAPAIPAALNYRLARAALKG